MKYKEAQAELKKALNGQKTISIPKLKKIIEVMGVSLKHDKQHKPDDLLLKQLNNERTCFSLLEKAVEREKRSKIILNRYHNYRIHAFKESKNELSHRK